MVNIEIKARCSDSDSERIREILKSRNAQFQGTDHQTDTYFKVNCGRLKLREGSIENCLIYYDRQDIERPKKSEIILIKDPAPSLKDILSKALGILVVVDKEREIYFIDNIKFHIDTVKHLEGFFIEIEAIDKDGIIGEPKLLGQCQFYLDLFKIPEENLISNSYSDLLLRSRGLVEHY
jgi:predicted adenylyl cyclase CyaB